MPMDVDSGLIGLDAGRGVKLLLFVAWRAPWFEWFGCANLDFLLKSNEA